MCENHGRRYGGWILSTTFVGELPPCSVVVATHDADDDAVPVRLPVFRMSADGWSRVENEEDEEDGFWSISGASLLRGLTARRTVDAEATEQRRRREFAVCVPPLYGEITPATLVQFVELTRLLGAQHFVFYVSSSVPAVLRRVLARYESDGVATAVAWHLPAVVGPPAVWNNGQLLAANDCLYRTAHAFRYVAFNDVDEYIVPHSASNWSTMIAQLAAVTDRRRRRHRVPPGNDESTLHPTGSVT